MQIKTDTQEPDLETAMKVVYQWNYEPEIEELRRLYVKGAEQQWISERDVDWERPIDLGKFATTPVSSSIPFERCSYWRGLPDEVRWEATRRAAAFRLSNFLHGEQGALFVASQLVNCVPHTDAKFYAATQTMDEARHVEVFAKYLAKLDLVRPIAPALKSVLDTTLATGNWMHKLVGMQIVVEGLALFSFKRMRQMTEEPLLREILTYVSQDEARHHAYGVQYIERCAPLLGDADRDALEDFALDAAKALAGSQSQQGLLMTLIAAISEAGVDVAALVECVRQERDEITRGIPELHQLGPLAGFVIPTLKRCGLMSERLAGRFRDFLREAGADDSLGRDVEEFMRRIPELPEDTAAWVLSELA
jgi:hypothetical protein